MLATPGTEIQIAPLYAPAGRPFGLAHTVSVAGEVGTLSVADSQLPPTELTSSDKLSPLGVVVTVHV